MSPFIGCDRGFELLDSMYADCVNGRGGVLVVSGPVATGKSRLLQEFTDRVFESDAIVLGATASRTERAMPFEILAQLFQPLAELPEHRDDVSRLINSDVCSIVLSDAPAVDVERAYAKVFHTLWLILLRETARRPVVITVDDVQHTDDSSLRGLLFLARRLKFARCLMVLAEQSGLPHQQRPLLHADLFSQSHCRRVRLGPLDPEGVARMLTAARPGDDGAAALATACHAITGGNPFLVTSLIDDWVKSGAGDSLPTDQQLVNGAFGDAVMSCLHRSDPEVLQVATAAAILEQPTPERIAALLDMDENIVRRCESTLTATGLMDGWRYRHPATRQAVLAQLTPAEGGRLHLKAASLLHEGRLPREYASAHLLAAGVPLPQWSVQVLRDAAVEALFDDRRDIAVRCLELAHDTAMDPDVRGAIMAFLAVVEWRADPAAANRRFPALTEAMRAGHLSWKDMSTFVRLLLWHGHLGEAEEALDQILKMPPPTDKSALAEIGFLRAWLASSYPRLASRLPASFAAPEPGGPPAITCLCYEAAQICAAVLSGDIDETSIHRAEQMLESSRLDDSTLEPLVTALTALIYADRLTVAARLCDAMLDSATTCHAPTWHAVFAGCRAEIGLRQGDLDLARRHAEVALANISSNRWGPADCWPLSVLLATATEMGDLDVATRVVMQQLPAAALETRYGVHYLYARGRYFMARGRLSMALDDFQLCGDLLTEWKLDMPGLVPWRVGLAEAYLRMGDADRAREVAQQQFDQSVRSYPRVAELAQRILTAAAAKPAERLALLDAARGAGNRKPLARSLADRNHVPRSVAGTATVRGDGVPAPEPVQRHRAGSAATSTALDRNEEAQRDAAIDGLSESERRVAALAAQGHTNRQIASRLFITVSTVEQHLTSTYRKLKVRRRAELPVGLALLAVDPK